MEYIYGAPWVLPMLGTKKNKKNKKRKIKHGLKYRMGTNSAWWQMLLLSMSSHAALFNIYIYYTKL